LEGELCLAARNGANILREGELLKKTHPQGKVAQTRLGKGTKITFSRYVDGESKPKKVEKRKARRYR